MLRRRIPLEIDEAAIFAAAVPDQVKTQVSKYSAKECEHANLASIGQLGLVCLMCQGGFPVLADCFASETARSPALLSTIYKVTKPQSSARTEQRN